MNSTVAFKLKSDCLSYHITSYVSTLYGRP